MVKRTLLNSRRGIDPFRSDVPIVNPDGTPTREFLRNMLGQRSNNSGSAETVDEAIELANLIAENPLNTTAPITGGGLLGETLTPIGLANSGVTPGSYTNTNLTVDATGRITVAANGSSSGANSPFWAVQPTPPTIAGTGVTMIEDGPGVGTLTNVSRGMRLTANATVPANDNIVLADAVAPGSTFTFTTLLVPLQPLNLFSSYGVYFRDNATGRINFLALGVETATNTTPSFKRMRFNNINSFDSTFNTGNHSYGGPIWLRLVVDSTNARLDFSYDGEFFTAGFQESKTAWCANITHFGVFTDNCPVTGLTGTGFVTGQLIMAWTL
jgi:hypothetical protein